MKVDLVALQQRLHYSFNNPGLLVQAVTHRSFGLQHNERLEFLGDSVLGLCVADLLYQQLSHLPEGDLSRARSALVRQETLHQLALDLGLPELMLLGAGELRGVGRQRASTLANAVEALIGAVYLDGGFAAAQALVQRLYASVPIHADMPAINKDPKTALQEWLQARRLKLPAYKVTATLGAAHQQTFEVECAVAELNLSECGSGASRRLAEQAAAAALLQTIKNQAPP